MLTLTGLCAHSQYEAGEARLGDPGQLPRGGGCKAPSARTNKKSSLPPFCFTVIGGGMKRAICLCVSCRAETPSDVRTQISYAGRSHCSPSFRIRACILRREPVSIND